MLDFAICSTYASPVLTNEELVELLSLLQGLPSGAYELSEIYGSAWACVKAPTTFGRRFKKAVENGQVSGLTLGPKTDENHRTYVVVSRAP